MPLGVQAQGATPTAAGKGGTVAADQIIERYKRFAGGDANAKSLVNGLRSGEDITLKWDVRTCKSFEQSCTTNAPVCRMVRCTIGTPGCTGGMRQECTPGSTSCTDTTVCKADGWQIDSKSDTFSPKPAAPMGFGNVDIALALTEATLRPNATPPASDLKKNLLEILGKRASGQGWGDIAGSYGLQLKE